MGAEDFWGHGEGGFSESELSISISDDKAVAQDRDRFRGDGRNVVFQSEGAGVGVEGASHRFSSAWSSSRSNIVTIDEVQGIRIVQ